jgi:hypothetical protein
MLRGHLITWAAALGLAAGTAGAQDSGSSAHTEVFFGDTHLHTALSPDAYFLGNRTADPDTAYRFARGLPAIHPYHRARMRLETPLDFVVIADHAEMMGVPWGLGSGDAIVAETDSGRRFLDMLRAGDDVAVFEEFIGRIGSGEPFADLDTEEIRRTYWERGLDAAARHDEPGRFTTFVGWEWTSTPGGNNLHRVVFTPADPDAARQFLPYSSFDSARPEDLWKWLDDTSYRTGIDFVAIPHNSNLSGGLMFDSTDSDGVALTTEYARTRMRWEPVVEATQIKGDSETHPSVSPDDPFADFETFQHMLSVAEVEAAGEPDPAADYVRSGLKRGLSVEGELEANPYKFGLVGSTDSHTGFATAEEGNFGGKVALDSIPENKIGEVALGIEGSDMSASGLAAVWAERNDRASIFAAFKRKEVYATTGTRIRVRFFGGWGFEPEDADSFQLARTGYEKGVPMGGDLAHAPTDASPTFLIQAMMDPVGAKLDRMQVVKGWIDALGEQHERVYDVALSDGRKLEDGVAPPVGNTVDLETGTWTNSIGDAQLATVWTDPDFLSSQRAFYYVRVLEIPTPRHTLLDALALDREIEGVPETIQERAYTSPIWYTP